MGRDRSPQRDGPGWDEDHDPPAFDTPEEALAAASKKISEKTGVPFAYDEQFPERSILNQRPFRGLQMETPSEDNEIVLSNGVYRVEIIPIADKEIRPVGHTFKIRDLISKNVTVINIRWDDHPSGKHEKGNIAASWDVSMNLPGGEARKTRLSQHFAVKRPRL